MGELIKTGEFFMVYSEVPNMSEYNAEYAAKFPSNRKGSPDDETTGNGSGDFFGQLMIIYISMVY